MRGSRQCPEVWRAIIEHLRDGRTSISDILESQLYNTLTEVTVVVFGPEWVGQLGNLYDLDLSTKNTNGPVSRARVIEVLETWLGDAA